MYCLPVDAASSSVAESSVVTGQKHPGESGGGGNGGGVGLEKLFSVHTPLVSKCDEE